MNLNELFKIQAELDKRIVEEHNLQGVDLLDKKILALQVELGELANEWRGFKFWSKDQEPRVEVTESNTNCGECFYNNVGKNPLLEEYVDCLHFILSIGLELEYNKFEFEYLHEGNFRVFTETDTIRQFTETFQAIGGLITNGDLESYEHLFLYLIGLGRHMGFTWEQIEQAYLDKNKINHERQERGY